MPRSRKQDTVEQYELQAVIDWVNSLREMNNLTQNDFANKIGVSTTYVNMLIQQKRKPSIHLLKRIADTFNDTQRLRNILPRAYEQISSNHQLQTTDVLLPSSPLSAIFGSLNHQCIVSTGNFQIEEINDRGLESWGISSRSFILSEQTRSTDLISGDLIVYGEPTNRRWGYINSLGSEAFIISAGFHLREILQLTNIEWAKSGLQHLEVSQYPLKEYYEKLNVNKVRLILGLPPNLRSPINSHPSYQFLRPVDREVVDQVITRFTQYRSGETGYQPSQHR